VSNIPAEPGYGGCAFSQTDFAQITPEQEKVNLFVRGSLAGSESFMPFVEAGFFNSKLSASTTPTSVSSSWPDAIGNQTRSNTNIQLPGNHPDNPLGFSGRLRYLMADVGPRSNEFDTKVVRTLIGGKGLLAGWDYDTGFLYTQSETERVANGYVRDSVLKEVLAGTGPLGFYRLGANAHLNSAAMYAALSPTLESKSKTTVTSIDFKASREVMELAGGGLGIALGAEARRETTDSPAVPLTREADIVGLGFSEFSGKRNVLAAYAEVSAPVTKTLELNAAARADRYSDAGNSFTPKFGAKWKALPNLALRGSFAAGFRAPGPAENGNSSNGAFSNFVDPVRCAQTSSPADCGSGTTVVISVGNPDIKPEKSRSTSLGLVFEPAAGTSMTVDFWDIERRNEITGADVSLILANPGAFPGSSVVRDDNDLANVPGSGTVLAVSAPYINLAKTRTNGVDLDLRHAFRVEGLGRLSSSLTLTYVNSFERTLPDGTRLQYAGTHGPTVLSSNSGAPRTRAILGVDLTRDSFSLATQVNYTSGIRNVEYQGDPQGCLNTHADGSDAPGGCRIASFTTMDVYGKYALGNGLELYGSVQNLFDRIAPLDPQTYGAIHYNTSYHLSGAIGRFFTVGLKYRWM
jgi:iron complex outermembrane recepter protein